MESAGCQTETEMSAGCEIWPSLDWSCDLGTGTAWADGCPHWHLIASSRALAVSGKIPDFSHRRMSERTRKTLNGLKNQLIKELIFQLLLSKGALSPLLNESCYKQAFFQYVVRADALCSLRAPCCSKETPPWGVRFNAWSTCQNHGWMLAGVF